MSVASVPVIGLKEESENALNEMQMKIIDDYLGMDMVAPECEEPFNRENHDSDYMVGEPEVKIKEEDQEVKSSESETDLKSEPGW